MCPSVERPPCVCQGAHRRQWWRSQDAARPRPEEEAHGRLVICPTPISNRDMTERALAATRADAVCAEDTRVTGAAGLRRGEAPGAGRSAIGGRAEGIVQRVPKAGHRVLPDAGMPGVSIRLRLVRAGRTGVPAELPARRRLPRRTWPAATNPRLLRRLLPARRRTARWLTPAPARRGAHLHEPE
ncbi:MAG: hypothetical protein ACLSVD_09325 [Eggerthellaceae bacterium]